MRGSKFIPKILTGLVIIVISVSSVYSSGKESATVKSIPLTIMGRSVDINKNISRDSIRSALSEIIKEEASVDTPEQLQYDVILVQEQAPATIIFNFNKKGIVDRIMLDSYTSEQNPPVTGLLSWLTKNAGKPKVRKKGNTIWLYGGWKIEHVNKIDGEDSVYRIEFTISK